MKRFFTTTTGWAILLAVAGMAGCAILPWCRAAAELNHVADLRQRLPPDLFGYEFLLVPEPIAWILELALFLTGCLLLATEPLDPVPGWRSAILVVCGALVITLCAVALAVLDRWGMARSLLVGLYFVAAVGAAFLLIASLEVRLRLRRRSPALSFFEDDPSDSLLRIDADPPGPALDPLPGPSGIKEPGR